MPMAAEVGQCGSSHIQLSVLFASLAHQFALDRMQRLLVYTELLVQLTVT